MNLLHVRSPNHYSPNDNATIDQDASVYGWLILPDDELDGPIEQDMLGPTNLSPTLRARLLDGDGERFRMGERTYRGDEIYNEGRFLGATASRHTPLTEYGFAWSGATWIEYELEGTWVRLRNPWAATARTRWRHRRYWLGQLKANLLHALGRHVWNPDRSQCLHCYQPGLASDG
jgi:hypothetical protein